VLGLSAAGARLGGVSDAFEAESLVKRFGRTVALAGIDLRVRAGEVHAFLGPNGAGKTTTIRILLGLLRADGGTVRLLGGDPWRDVTTLHRRLAYVPGDVSLWPSLSGGETIDLLGRLRGGLDPRRRAELLDRFELDPRKRNRTYSKGNRQKVALVAALAADVELLVLDEPTSGPAVEAELAWPPDGLAGLPGVHELEVSGSRVTCHVDAGRLGPVLRHLADHGIRSLESRPPALEELFLRHYRAETPAAAAAGGAR
jgi:ABC-type branched-subunit amino acid transport system ATPase component